MLRKLYALLVLSGLASSTAHATHMSGGEIYYTCLGNDQYEITLMIYRDCAGVQVDPNFDVTFSSPCDTFTVQVNTPNGVEISQLCGLQLPNSTCNGGSLPGIESYTYTTIVTLPPCDTWNINWSLQNRNWAIANLVDPGNEEMFIQATLNNTVDDCDASPQFTGYASPFVCLNYPVTYSLGAYDVDGDSLTYTLIDAMGAGGVPIAYVPPYTGIEPITGLTLDPQTGLITFTPTQAGNWVVVVQVNEYDSLGNLIGTVMRDMQFIAYPCSNVPPNASSGVVTNPTGSAVITGTNEVQVCESGSFCFDMVINDINASNILDAVTNLSNVLPGATFTFTGTNPITCTVCWTGSNGTAGYYPFTVNVNDGACPIPALQTYAYTIHVIDGIFINVQSTDASCMGINDGTAQVTVMDGAPPYQVDWIGLPDTTYTIIAGAGSYPVQVTDGNGCISAASTAIINAPIPTTAGAGPDQVACLGEYPVQLTGTVSNGMNPTWTGGAGSFVGGGANVQYTPTAAEIIAGGVDLSFIVYSNTTCPNDTDDVHLFLSNSFLSASISGVDATCDGGADGSAAFLPNDPALTYLWDDPNAQNTSTASGLSAGTYSVLVTDPLGCDTTMSVTISAPAAITLVGLQATYESCAGSGDGSIVATVTGGTPPYHYDWSTGDTTASIIVGSGTYTVSITDANGCGPAQGTSIVLAMGQPNVAQGGPDLIVCMGELPVILQGSVVNATGGTWSGGNGSFQGSGLTVAYIPTMAETIAGGVTLYLTTTGNTTCPPDVDTVFVALSNSFLTASISADSVSCAGGSTGTAVFLPNNPSLDYQWNDPAGQTTSTATGLASGTYSVTVTDALGCDTTMSVFVPEPLPLSVATATGIDPLCSGGTNGSATVVVSGGTPAYHYQWSANANSQTTQTATGLGAGSYIVVVTDANNCTTQAGITLIDPPPIMLAAQVPDTVCVNAPVQLTAIAGGGDGNYTITWQGIGLGSPITYSFPASQIVTVTVTDGAGCAGPTLSFPVYVLDLSLANLDVYGDTIACPGESATVSATLNNYAGPYSISWPELGENGNGPFSVPVTADQTLHVIVTDGCGATLTDQVQLHLDVPPTITLPPLIAEGCEPLTVQFPDSLTTQNVSYLWSFGDNTTSTAIAPTHTYDDPGTYTVSLVVTTAAGCSAGAMNTGEVIVHPAPTAAFTASTWQTDMTAPTIDFTSTSSNDVVLYDWSFGDGDSDDQASTSHTYDDVGTYAVQLWVQNSFGCVDSVTNVVTILPDYTIVIPNAFTPDPGGGNGGSYDPTDLTNNVFYPFVRFTKEFRIRVWNRWGELVFESKDILKGWDGYYRGQMSPQDVYVYSVWIRFVDDREIEKMGDLTLFR